MLRFGRISITMIVLSILVLACAFPSIMLQDSDAISTAAAQTVIAGFVQTALSLTSSSPLLEPPLTFTPESPTLSPTLTLTPTQTLTATSAFTPTPLVPQISVSVPTFPGWPRESLPDGRGIIGRRNCSGIRPRPDRRVLVHSQPRCRQ